MNVTGKRRFYSFLATLAGVIAIEIVNPNAAGGISGSAQLALTALAAMYFGADAAIKRSYSSKE